MSFRVKSFALAALLAFSPAVVRAAYDGAANFNDHVAFTVKGSSVALNNFPLLVRVSEAQLPGFKYSRADQAELAFVNENGDAIPYEVDTWNTAGESLIWVKTDIPTTDARIIMYWSLKDGGVLPSGITSADVWSEYVGVWHFNEEIAAADAATTVSKDSTANGLDAAPVSSNADTLPQMVSQAGVFGNARVNASNISGIAAGANHLEVGHTDALNLGSVFTFSGWIKYGDYAGSPRIVSKAAADQTGWEVESNSGDRKNIRVRSNGDSQMLSNCQVFANSTPKNDGYYTYITIVFDNGSTTVYGYSEGHYYKKTGPTTLTAPTNSTYSLTFGGDQTSKTYTIWGSYDEFRLRNSATTQQWLEAETNNYGQATYLDARSGDSFIVPGAVVTNSVVNDYWLENPSISPAAWTEGEVSAEGFVVNGGALRSGNSSRKYTLNGTLYDDASELAAALTNLGEGDYTISCTGGETKSDDYDIAVNVKFKAAETYLDQVTFTLNGIGTTPVSDYIMLLRLSEEQLPGFKYARTGGKDKIAFTDGDGIKLSYDVDTWNAFGESLVWVKVPVATNGTTVTMHWKLADGKAAPYNNPAQVWSDYVGVWHLNEEISSADAAETVSKDATSNRYDAVPQTQSGNIAQMASTTSAVFGNARVNATAAVYGGNSLAVTNSFELGGAFTFSGWFNIGAGTYSGSGSPVLVTKKSGFKVGSGWEAALWGQSGKRDLAVFGNTGDDQRITVSDENLDSRGYVYLTFVYNGSSLTTYADNRAGVSRTITAAADNSNPLCFGGSMASSHRSLLGSYDELRLRKGAVTSERVFAEYNNAIFNDYLGATEGVGSFLVPGAVVKAGETNDYWRVYPSISASYWEEGDAPATVVYTAGELRSGADVTVVCETDVGLPVACDPFDSDALKALDVGAYRIRCYRTDMSGAIVDDAIVYFTITEASGVSGVGDSGSGRILLMNNDWTAGGSASNPQVGGQGWANTNLMGTAGTFWMHLNDSAGYDNVQPGTESVLMVADGANTNELWHLVNCRHGNTFPTTSVPVTATDGLLGVQNYLPASANSGSIKNTMAMPTRRNGVGQLLMQNTLDAVVYSPCYTNGIGTIYFDAVNGWNNNIGNYKELSGDSSNTNAYQLVVEVSTAPLEVASTNIAASAWSAVTCNVVRVSGGTPAMSKVAETENVALTIADGGTMDEFYRIYVPIEERGTVRFRIRRTGMDNGDSTDTSNPEPDASAYILIDNIVVSYPRMTAELHPAGVYFDKSGKDVLGMEGAFVDGEGNATLPMVGDEIYGRAVPEYYVNASTNLTETNFIASARMHYRWRYLNQLLDEWRTVSLAPQDGFRSTSALKLPDMVGDVEFWFDATLQIPYYKYVDYSGKGLAAEFMAIYSEKASSMVNSATKVESFGYPSMGTDWFVRLRENESGYEGVYLQTKAADGSVCQTNSMMLVAKGQWRGFVQTISEIDAGLDFRFEGVRLQVADDGTATLSTNSWTAASDAMTSIPASCGIQDSDEWRTTICDAKTGYLVFTFDENRETITICRGDWQDFNRWSSAANTSELFVGSSIDTNTTTDVTKEYVAEIYDDDLCPVSKSTNVNWAENFDVEAGQVTEEIYPRDVPIAKGKSEHGWTVENASWTFQRWACNFGNGIFGGKSAVQLEGRGKGSLSFVSDTDYPEGLEYMQFTTRVAQFNAFNNFAYYSKGTNTFYNTIYFPEDRTNYTFTTFAALTLDKKTQDYDGDGSISLVAYYDPSYGAYEVRVSRGGDNGTNLRFVLLKWYATGGGMACEVLGTNNFNNVSVEDGLMRSDNDIEKLCHFYVSVREYTTTQNGIVTGTLIHAGLSREPQSTNSGRTPGNMNGIEFDSNVYFDTSSTRLTHGTFGVLARNCAGAFIKPVFFDSPIVQIGDQSYEEYPNRASGRDNLQYYTRAAVTFGGSSTGNYPEMSGVSDETQAANRDAYYNCWAIPPGRTLPYIDTSIASKRATWGFTGITNVLQTIAVQTTPHGGSDWTTITNITVDSFVNKTNICYFYTHSPCDVRLQVGGGPNDPRLDVTVDDVMLAKWDGEWTPGWEDDEGMPTNYVYTSAWIVKDDDQIGQKAVRFQPARARTDDMPVSLRSPMMNGAGLFHFSWRNADTAHTVLKLQKCKNPSGYLRALTKTSKDSRWIDVETVNITEASGGKTFFLNERYDGKTPIVLRLIVDPEVVATARAGTDPYYGSIEITDSYVWDLPPYDKRSWIGWNFRTEGWYDSADTMWANLTDFDRGLSGLLNNTVDENTLAEPTRADAYTGHMPYVQSPTFETNCIGSVEFRARLYDPAAASLAGHPAVVTIYGAKREDIDETTDEPKYWNKITDIEVSGTVYEKVSAKFKSGDQYCVLRFSVSGVDDVTPSAGDNVSPAKYHPPLRVAIDDICILERPMPSIRFKKGYARPFRNADAIKDLKPVLDIATSAEQPIIGETFGFQAEIELNDIEDEIETEDKDKPIRVYVAYYPYADSWGWKNWIDTTNETGKAVIAELVPAEGTNLVYRSSLDNSSSMCSAQLIGDDSSLYDYQRYRLVQYHLFVTYYDKSGELHADDEAYQLSAEDWDMPEWNHGFDDPNKGADFSAFTLLESLAPKQAWINEVSLTEDGYEASRTNQWIEIAMPSGEDMTYWTVRLYNCQANVVAPSLFTFGLSGAAKTVDNATEESGDYSFYVAKSPATTSLPSQTANATWPTFTAYGVSQGMLARDQPFGFELVRPSGVVEHSVVVQGFNIWAKYAEDDPGYEQIAAENSGTNLVALLKAKVGGDWVWGEEDFYNKTNSTVGVTNGMGRVHADWSSPMSPTPGAINVGQKIGEWYVHPNGGYWRIFSNIAGEHIGQTFGGQSGSRVIQTVTEGASTNIVFTIDKWYQLSYETDHPEGRTKKYDLGVDGDGSRVYELSLSNISNNVTITAWADIADEVSAHLPDSEDGEAYKPAIMNWLAAGKAGENGDAFVGTALTNGLYRGHDGSISNTIELLEMYWLDLDPTQPGWELWGGMGAHGNGVATNRVKAITTTNRVQTAWGVTHTNIVVSAWLMITNTATGGPAYPPYRLQGLANEKSDAIGSWTSWTSVTFKISMQLRAEGQWRDLRYFVFDGSSFSPATADPAFTTTIEIMDPHSMQSPMARWGWYKYDMEPWARWKIDSDGTTVDASVLRQEDSLEGSYPPSGG